jgi:hypothetical protein
LGFSRVAVEGTTVLMSLEEEIAELKKTIRGYEEEYKATDKANKEEIRRLSGLIISARENLLLLQQKDYFLLQREDRQLVTQQQQPNQGNF